MDILIKNGAIIDGTGKAAWKGDVAVHDGRIRDAKGHIRGRADQTIEADGLVVAPGFVDILNHADAYLTLLRNPASESLIAQGITTAVIGNCGASLAPITHGKLIAVIAKWSEVQGMNLDWERFGEFLDVVDRLRPGVNIAGLVGHTTLRRAIIGDAVRVPKESELDAMAVLLEGALADGAFGLSFAPSYAHARVAPQWEIDALAQTLSRIGGYLAVHLRDEKNDVLESAREAIGIAQRADVPLEISHLKAVGGKSEGQLPETLAAIDAAVREGVDVHFDVFPWRTSLTVLYPLFPAWAQEGGFSAIRKRLRDQTIRAKVIHEMRGANIRWDDYVIAEGKHNGNAIGKSVARIAQIMGVTPEEAATNLFLQHDGRVMLFRRGEPKRLLLDALCHERSFVASAGGGYAREHKRKGFLVHPRSFGTMPKVLGQFVRDERVLPLEKAVAKMSGRPAAKVGLAERGIIGKNKAADLVVFDPDRVGSRATLRRPFRYPDGIRWVIVNGKIALNPDGLTGTRAGRALRRRRG